MFSKIIKNSISEVVLDLSTDKYSDAIICNVEELVHADKIIDLLQIVKKQIESINNYTLRNSNEEVRRHHQTISVFGSRGVGKTTFLMSALELIRSDDKANALCLRIIDPSTIEGKQHPFINIIAEIHKEIKLIVERKLGICSPRDKNYEQFNLWQESYRKLLSALPSIDGVGQEALYKDWDDAEYIAQQGMNFAESANDLEFYFHQYIFKSLNLIDRKCIILSFDDIDTNFNKGFQVLETIRKYVTTPQIITIITGDFELYGKLVRQAQWAYFDESYLKKEIEYSGRRKEEFSELTNQLENQYLMKILKPRNRIILNSITEKESLKRNKIKIKSDNGEIADIDKYYDAILNEIGYKTGAKVKELIIRIFCDLPIRTQIQILLLKLQRDSSKKSIIIFDILNIFWSEINQKSQNAKYLTKESEVYPMFMLRFLLENDILERSASFIPEQVGQSLNLSLIIIGAFCNHQIENNLSLVFDYWMRVSYIEKLYGYIVKSKEDKYSDLNKILYYSDFINDSGLNKSYCLCEAYLTVHIRRSPVVDLQLMPGVIKVTKYSPLFRNNANTLISQLPMFEIQSYNGTSITCISFYKILALIGDLIRAYDGRSPHNDIHSFSVEFEKLAQYRSYLEPNGPSPSNFSKGEKRSLYHFDIKLDSNDEESNVFINSLYHWLESQKGSFSVYFLNRIFTRFYYTLSFIDNRIQAVNVGEKMHLYTVAFLNSVLVEEALDKGYSDVLLANNDDINKIYLINLDIINKKRCSLNVARWFSSSPIFNAYLNPLFRRIINYKALSSDVSNLELWNFQMIKSKLETNKKVLENIKERWTELGSEKRKIDNFIRYSRDIQLNEAKIDFRDELDDKGRIIKKLMMDKGDFITLFHKEINSNKDRISELGLSEKYTLEEAEKDQIKLFNDIDQLKKEEKRIQTEEESLKHKIRKNFNTDLMNEIIDQKSTNYIEFDAYEILSEIPLK